MKKDFLLHTYRNIRSWKLTSTAGACRCAIVCINYYFYTYSIIRGVYFTDLITVFVLHVCLDSVKSKDCVWPWASARRGKWGQLTPWKMDEKLKSENMQNSSFLNFWTDFIDHTCSLEKLNCWHELIVMFMLYFESNRGRQMKKTALCWPHIYSVYFKMHHFVVNFFKIFFASGDKGALTTLTKILRTLLCLTVNVKLTVCRSLVRDVVRFVIVVSALNNG